MTNIAWKTDNKGKYIEFNSGTSDIEISFDFKNLLLTNENINSITYNTALDVSDTTIFGFTSHKTTAVLTFGTLPTTTGIYNLQFNITTDQNRVYNQYTRIKIK